MAGKRTSEELEADDLEYESPCKRHEASLVTTKRVRTLPEPVNGKGTTTPLLIVDCPSFSPICLVLSLSDALFLGFIWDHIQPVEGTGFVIKVRERNIICSYSLPDTHWTVPVGMWNESGAPALFLFLFSLYKMFI